MGPYVSMWRTKINTPEGPRHAERARQGARSMVGFRSSKPYPTSGPGPEGNKKMALPEMSEHSITSLTSGSLGPPFLFP